VLGSGLHLYSLVSPFSLLQYTFPSGFHGRREPRLLPPSPLPSAISPSNIPPFMPLLRPAFSYLRRLYSPLRRSYLPSRRPYVTVFSFYYLITASIIFSLSIHRSKAASAALSAIFLKFFGLIFSKSDLRISRSHLHPHAPPLCS
jgi:hypothetical protein